MQQAVQLRWREGRQCKHDCGFTIVELIIVIIVIAILSVIAVTAYNGVQTKAKNAKTVTAVAAYVKAIHLYAADRGTYPPDSAVCLGDNYPGDKCALIDPYPGSGIGPVHENTSFNAALLPYFGNGGLPMPSTQPVAQQNGLRFVGAYWDTRNVNYWLSGDVSCGSPGGVEVVRSVYSNNTRCWFQFDPL